MIPASPRGAMHTFDGDFSVVSEAGDNSVFSFKSLYIEAVHNIN